MTSAQPYTRQRLLQAAWRRKWVILLPMILIGASGAAWVYQLPDRYRAETSILIVPQRVPESYVRSTVSTRIEDRLQTINQQILSRTQLELIVNEFNLYADRRKLESLTDIIESMRARDIDVRISRRDTFRLSFMAETPQLAMSVTARLASLFIDESLRDRAVLAEGTDSFLETQLESARARLVENEKRLEAYRRLHAGELPAQLDSNLLGLHNTEMQLQALRESLSRDHDRRLALERASAEGVVSDLIAAAVPPRATTEAGDPPQPIAEQLKNAEATLRALEMRVTSQHPDVVALKQSISELEQQAAAERAAKPPSTRPTAEVIRKNRMDALKVELDALDQQLQVKTAEEQRLQAIISGYQRRIEAEPTREAELAGLTRDYDTLQQTYRTLLGKKQESQIAANLEKRQIGEQFRVLDPARLPERPFTPNRRVLYPAGFLGGLGLGLVLAILLESFDRSLRTEEDVQSALGLSVLATIPSIRFRRPRPPRQKGFVSAMPSGPAAPWTATSTALVVHPDADEVLVEQYRRLAASLRHEQLRRQMTTVFVASALEREGKTLTATNLALALSQSFQQRVLLIDADFQRPAVAELLQLENVTVPDAGPNQIASAALEPSAVVSPTLEVMIARRPTDDVGSVLVSERIQSILARARGRFDWIVIDTPPVAVLPDAGLLAEMVDGIIVVASTKTPPFPLLTRAVAALGTSRILGVVLNHVERSTLSAGYRYSRYYRQSKHRGRVSGLAG